MSDEIPRMRFINIEKCDKCGEGYCLECIKKAMDKPEEKVYKKRYIDGDIIGGSQTVIFEQSKEDKQWHEWFWNEVAKSNEIAFTKYATESWCKIMGLRQYYGEWKNKKSTYETIEARNQNANHH